MQKRKDYKDAALEHLKKVYDGSDFKILNVTYLGKSSDYCYKFLVYVLDIDEKKNIFFLDEVETNGNGVFDMGTEVQLTLEEVKAIQKINTKTLELVYK